MFLLILVASDGLCLLEHSTVDFAEGLDYLEVFFVRRGNNYFALVASWYESMSTKGLASLELLPLSKKEIDSFGLYMLQDITGIRGLS